MNVFKSVFLSITFFAFLAQPVFGQWIAKNFPYTDNLVKISFATENVGWVLGNKHIYRTSDGGDNWVEQDSVWGFGLGLYALNDSTALYTDYTRGIIRRTSDKGTTWSTVDSMNYYIYDIKFWDSSVGYAVGGLISSTDTAVAEKTTDGGETWNTISKVFIGIGSKTNYDFESISLVDNSHFWAVTYGANIYYSTDGGNNWSFNDSIRVSDPGQPLRDIQFVNANSGWAVGGIAGDAVIARTTDGGANWSSSIISAYSSASIQEIHMINSQTGWFVAKSNGPSYLAKTTDGGNTWLDQTPPIQNIAFDGFQSMSVINDTVSYVVGDYISFSDVWKTATGGITAVDNSGLAKILSFYLAQNYPNPFNPTTVIKYQVPKASDVTITVYDILGREVSTLVNEFESAGSYNVTFNAEKLSSGVYIYQMKAGNFISTKKLVLMK